MHIILDIFFLSSIGLNPNNQILVNNKDFGKQILLT